MAIPYYGKLTPVKRLKRYIKYLAVSKDPTATAAVLRTAPDPVIKSVCNAAENVLRGNINLTRAQKKIFKKNKELIIKLRTRSISIPAKRKLLSQKGGAAWIPILLSTVLSALASSFFQKQQ